MAPRRPTSSQNSKANDDVPPPVEGLPPMNEEGLIRYLGTLAGLVDIKLEHLKLMVMDNPHFLGVAPLMILRGWVLLIFLALQIKQRQKLGFLR